MPSLRAICVGLLLTPLLQLSAAIPVGPPGPGCPAPPAPPAAPAPPAKAAPALPASGSKPDLNSTALTLQYVTIGRGIQNYTCSTVGANATAIGAIATLYDATALAYANLNMLHSIPPLAVNVPMPKGAALNMANAVLKPIGNHYFDAAGTPTFDLTAVKKTLFAGKIENVPAPAGASKGPSGTGAVDWLNLKAKATYTSTGLGQVYRVETAGGKAVCTVAGPQSVQYAAEYWFYA